MQELFSGFRHFFSGLPNRRLSPSAPAKGFYFAPSEPVLLQPSDSQVHHCPLPGRACVYQPRGDGARCVGIGESVQVAEWLLALMAWAVYAPEFLAELRALVGVRIGAVGPLLAVAAAMEYAQPFPLPRRASLVGVGTLTVTGPITRRNWRRRHTMHCTRAGSAMPWRSSMRAPQAWHWYWYRGIANPWAPLASVAAVRRNPLA